HRATDTQRAQVQSVPLRYPCRNHGVGRSGRASKFMTAPEQSLPAGMPSSIGSSNIAPPAANELLHGATLRPPVLRWNGSAYTGAQLTHLEAEAALHT